MNSLLKLRDSKRPILTCYLPLSDPAMPDKQAAIYAECGVDIFEVGIPCADPYMDGPVVSGSMQRIIAAGVTQSYIAKKISGLKQSYQDIAIVVMGYENMDLAELVVNDEVNFDGVLRIGTGKSFTDEEFSLVKNAEHVSPITFVPYEMSPQDVERACAAHGYIMLQASPGKTGVRDSIDESSCEKIRQLKQAGAKVPVLSGIGISTPEQAAAAIALGADGVIIGSACLLKAQEGKQALKAFLLSIREAMDDVWI